MLEIRKNAHFTRFCTLVLSLLIFTLDSRSETYYVSISGTGLRDGKSSGNSLSWSQFKDSSRWSSSLDPANFGPGDHFIFLQSLPEKLICTYDGTPTQPIIYDLHGNELADAGFSFNGKSYLTLENFNAPETIGSALITFGPHSGAISQQCTVRAGYSKSKTGGSLIHTSNSDGTVIENCTFTNFVGNCISGDAAVKNLTIRNNSLSSSPTAESVTTDFIKLGWAEDVLIENNLMIMRTSKDSGDPHNDIMQCWYNYSNTAQRPANWKIRNNWIEIDSAQGKGFVNFSMFQYMTGVFEITGNVFYTHDLSSTIGQGLNFARNPDGNFTLLILHNTFISRRGGFSSQVNLAAGMRPSKVYVYNNMFFKDATGGAPIVEDVSSNPKSLLMASGNRCFGWNALVQRVSYSTAKLLTYTDSPNGTSAGTRDGMVSADQILANPEELDFTPKRYYRPEAFPPELNNFSFHQVIAGIRARFPGAPSMLVTSGSARVGAIAVKSPNAPSGAGSE